MIRKKIEKEFVVGLESQEARENNSRSSGGGKEKKSMRSKERKTVLATFKVSKKIFLTA